MFLFVVNWADYENTCEYPLTHFLTEHAVEHLTPGHRPTGSARVPFPCCLGVLHSCRSEQPLWCYSTSPFIKTSLATEDWPVDLPCCIPLFPSLRKANENQYSIAKWLLTAIRRAELLGLHSPSTCTHRSNSAFWPGRSRHKLFSDTKALSGTFLWLYISLVNAPKICVVNDLQV